MSEIRDETTDQQLPKGTGPEIFPLVIADIEKRAEVGFKKYGERLKAFNGRSALRDAYEESLDLAIYLRQMIEESDKLLEEAIERNIKYLHRISVLEESLNEFAKGLNTTKDYNAAIGKARLVLTDKIKIT